jgi:hypothetical protein
MNELIGALNKHQSETQNTINREKWVKDEYWHY